MNKVLARRQKQIRRRRRVLITSFILAAAAWFYGYLTSGTEILPRVPEVIPGAVRIEPQGDIYLGFDQQDELLGYAAVGESPGYCGPIQTLVGLTTRGEIIQVKVIDHCETPGFFRLINSQGFTEQFVGKEYKQPLALGQGLDAVSGATLSSEGIAASTREAVRIVARDALENPLPPEKKQVKFGWPEIAVLSLYLAGYIGHKLRGPWKKRIRWGTLLTGMIVIGFIYTIPITIGQLIAFLSGYWPDWHHNLYWYFLLGGILFVTTVDAKNPYCSWFCPFGAYQETLAQITNAPIYKPRKWREAFTWLQRGLAWIALVLGLALRNPGVASFEPFATLFDIRGSIIQWIFLGVITITSLIMYRPFCNYLCPIDPAVDFIAEIRGWVMESLKKWRSKSQG
ncbi:MAG: FMN-binding protein [Anaerolineales bacterium]|nr:FMN-binding protein [Anaerolineales bacterium]